MFDEIARPAWLTNVLRKSLALDGSRVTAVAAERIGAEVGFLDSVARLTLTYDVPRKDAPTSIVAKVSASEPLYRQIGEFYNAYECEFRFYECIAPGSPVRLPKCYGREILLDTKTHVLLLEDMGTLVAGDQVQGLTLDRARAAVETIGRFHAAWWESPGLANFAWMPSRNIQPARYRMAWPLFKESIGPRLSASAIALGEHLEQHFEEVLGEMERGPHTIVHSDFRADNLLFDDGNPREPVVILDWQLAIRGRGILDVARLLGGSLAADIRAASETALLQAWHAQLLAGGVRDYSFAQALVDYRAAKLLCLYYPVTIHSAEEAAGARGTALARAQIERFFAAAMDGRE